MPCFHMSRVLLFAPQLPCQHISCDSCTHVFQTGCTISFDTALVVAMREWHDNGCTGACGTR